MIGHEFDAITYDDGYEPSAEGLALLAGICIGALVTSVIWFMAWMMAFSDRANDPSPRHELEADSVQEQLADCYAEYSDVETAIRVCYFGR